MTMQVSSGGGRRFRAGPRRFRRGLMSDINVTPMVDVMLVLLIVFMVTAPLLTIGVPVDLPRTAASQMLGQDEPLVITIDQNGGIFLQETRIPLEELVPKLTAILANRRDTRIFVRGDQKLAYGTVMQVMGTVSSAGFGRVALVTEMPREEQRGGRR